MTEKWTTDEIEKYMERHWVNNAVSSGEKIFSEFGLHFGVSAGLALALYLGPAVFGFGKGLVVGPLCCVVAGAAVGLAVAKLFSSLVRMKKME